MRYCFNTCCNKWLTVLEISLVLNLVSIVTYGVSGIELNSDEQNLELPLNVSTIKSNIDHILIPYFIFSRLSIKLDH